MRLTDRAYRSFMIITIIDEQIMTEEMKQWFPRSLIHEGVEYEAKVRLRGDFENHWRQAKKSWRIKFRNAYLFECPRFST